MDKVLIQELRVKGILGVNDEERNTLGEIAINVTLFTEPRPATLPDVIDGCVDYSNVAKDIRLLVKARRRFTVEALAQDIADLCLSRENVRGVTVKVEKPGDVSEARSVGVEIERQR